MDNHETNFDAIVIGTGPGGASVARELATSGHSVLILERGDNAPTRGKVSQMFSRGWIPGSQLTMTTGGKPILRGITTGGTTNVFTATAYDPPHEILAKYGIDIRDELKELRAELPIGPIDDRLMSPAASEFMSASLSLGYDCHKLDKFIIQDKCLQDCSSCMLGCPNGAKWNAKFYVEEAVRSGATLVNHAYVKRVVTDKGRAVGVEYRQGGKRKAARAHNVIVAAGGIGSPLILKKSGLRGVGRDICVDPVVVVFGRVPGLKGTGRAVPMMTGFHLKEEGVMLSDLHMPKVLKTIFDIQALNLGRIGEFEDVIPVMVKVRDELSGRIYSNGLMKKNISRADRQKIDLGVEISRAILAEAGATEIYESAVFAGHPGASVKIGEFLDSDLQSKVEGLWVCDCSVYPEALGIPPSLMLLALGRRLGRHINATLGDSTRKSMERTHSEKGSMEESFASTHTELRT